MKIVVVGAGWTGLTAAYRLVLAGHKVVILEQGKQSGGLAGSYRKKEWQWPLEKFYHHWFTNDDDALGLARELKHKVLTLKPRTAVLQKKKIYLFDNPLTIMSSPLISWIAKLRMSMVLVYLKLLPSAENLTRFKALPWLKKYMGEEPVRVIWEPLLRGKFGIYAKTIGLSWFYARIKKRTMNLSYPVGGFAKMGDKLVRTIKQNGGQVKLGQRLRKISAMKGGGWKLITHTGTIEADKVLLTVPSSVVTTIVPELPQRLYQKLKSIQHLSAQVLILELSQPMIPGVYWLNVTEKQYPFLAIVEHTNMVSPQHYGGRHIVYIGNYLPNNHPYLSLNARQLYLHFKNRLADIAPDFEKYLIRYTKWQLPNAQPIVDTLYELKIPPYRLHFPGLYLANMDMVYPWDRGTNYAIMEGNKIAKMIDQDFLNRT